MRNVFRFVKETLARARFYSLISRFMASTQAAEQRTIKEELSRLHPDLM